MADPITTIGLCAGVGWLDEAVRAGLEYLGFEHRTACLCEWESFAAAVLLARMEDASMEPAPVWCGDLADFDGRAFRGSVDGIVAGLPCQPYSNAGKRAGNSDRRSYGDGDGPIPHALRIIEECDASLVFFENVPAWVTGGWFRPVGEELCRMGFTLEDPIFVTAESVGASHRRERVFILGHRCGWVANSSRKRRQQDARSSPCDEGTDARRATKRDHQPQCAESDLADTERPDARSGTDEGQAGQRRHRPAIDGAPVAVTGSDGGRIDEPGRRPDRGTATGGTGVAVGDSDESGSQGRVIGGCGRADEWIAGTPSDPLFAPGPGADWSGIPEWLWPATQQQLHRVADGSAGFLDVALSHQFRADRLRCIGNGVVPICAATAFVEIIRRAQLTPKANQ